MSLVLDAGAFLAVERGDREIIALIKRERLHQRAPLTHGGVVAQIWRTGSGRQAEVARFLKGVDIRPLDATLGKSAGALLGKARTDDAIDSAVICLATDGDDVLTSDPADLEALAEAAGVHIDLILV